MGFFSTILKLFETNSKQTTAGKTSNADNQRKTGAQFDNEKNNNSSDHKTSRKIVGNVVIPEGTIEISDNRFFGNKQITSVTIPGTVKRIGEGAFSYCRNIQNVVLHEGIEVIEFFAFGWCEKLRRVTFPDSVKEVHLSVFFGTNLEAAVLNASGTVLFHCPDSVFHGEWSAPNEGLCLPEGLEIIKQGAVSLKEIREITVPYSVREIEDRAFYECKKLEKVTILNPKTKLAACAFSGCYNLQEIHYADLYETDRICHLKGIPFLNEKIEEKAILQHRTDPEFISLTEWCAKGNSDAMYALSEWFEKMSHKKSASPFYRRASNYWRYRAYLKGNGKACTWFKKFFTEHPGERLESVLFEFPLLGFFSNAVSGEMLNDLGFSFFDSEKEYDFDNCEDEDVVVVSTFESYDGPDEDGFGMEDYYDWWFLDENMQQIPGTKKINASSREKRLSQFRNELAKAKTIMKQRKSGL